jgi:hypothetical protein
MKHVKLFEQFLNESNKAHNDVLNILKTLHGFSNKIKFRISNMLKKVAPEFNKYLNGNLELWAIGVSAEKAFYKDRNLGPGVGNQM